MAPVVVKVTEPMILGEGPHWHSEENALYFVNIGNSELHKYDPATGKDYKVKLPTAAHFILPIEGKKNRFLITQGCKVVEIEWYGYDNPAKILRTITEVDKDFPENILNDGKADPLGRLFTGTMSQKYDPGPPLKMEKVGSLYRIDPDGTTTKFASDIMCSNGLCWDLKEKAFYYVDSLTYAIQRYDYDVATGDISNPRNVFSLKEHKVEGSADGMTIDTDGNLWIAIFGPGSVIKVDPRTNKLLETISIPAKQVASVTFGGQNLDVLYVTTACLDLGGKPEYPGGATFAVTGINAKGYPNLKIRLEY